MPHFVFESLGMLLLPMLVIVGAVPRESLPVSRSKYAAISLLLVWPLGILTYVLFEEQSQMQTPAVFGSTALGLIATLICVQALYPPASSPKTPAIAIQFVDWWQTGWRLLVVWFAFSTLTGALAGIAATAAGYPNLARTAGGFSSAAALLLASWVLHLRSRWAWAKASSSPTESSDSPKST